MRTNILILVLASLPATMGLAQKSAPLSPEQLAEISARGRMLAEYDEAAWHATDAVIATHPKQDDNSRFVCRKDSGKWTCIFGRLGADRLLIDYEAVQGVRPTDFEVKHHEPAAEETGFYFAAVKAMMTAGKDFQRTAEKRPYNPSVLPAVSGQFYVYMVPAQTKKGVYAYGGDARFLISADGSSIVEKRQLHKSILETRTQDAGDKKVAGGVHNHVLSDVPEDTDVFYVLTRKPSAPEYIGTPSKLVYVVEKDGRIRITK
jgi:hypothetical protein